MDFPVKFLWLLLIIIMAASAGGGSAAFEDRSNQGGDRQKLGSFHSQSERNIALHRAESTIESSAIASHDQNHTTISKPTSQSETANQTETTPTSTPTRVGKTVLVNGSISNPSPPGNTAIETTIELQFEDAIRNGTSIGFSENYTLSDIQLHSIQSPTTNETEAVTGHVRQLIINDTSRPGIFLTATNNVKRLNIIATIRHPNVETNSVYRLTAHPPESQADNKTTIMTYRVRAIGDDRRSGRTAEFDRVNGQGFIYSDATVYRGEADIEFRGALHSPLRGISGNAEGKLVRPPIPTDIPTGRYSSDGTNNTAAIRVQTAKMETLRVENTNDIDVSGGVVYPETTDALTVTAQSNFEDAEEIELTIRNADGVDITQELIETASVRPETPDGNPPIQATNINIVDENQINTGSNTVLDHEIEFTRLESSVKKSRSMRSPWSRDNHMIANDQTLTQVTGPVTPERKVNQTDVEPGAPVRITLTGVVDTAGTIQFEEEFSPAVTGAKVNSVRSSAGSVSPVIASATENGLAVLVTDVSAGSTVTVTYTIQTGASDATYRLEGSVETESDTTEYSDTAIIVGSGGNTELTSDGKVSWELDLTETQTDSISISVNGADDLTGQKATASTDVAISYDSISLSSKTTRPARGQNVKLSIENSPYGTTHTVIIPDSDLRPTLTRDQYDDVFRNVGTTQTTGFITQSGERVVGSNTQGTDPIAVFAEVRVDPDDGVGTTEVQTQTLADEATVELLDSRNRNNPVIGQPVESIDISIVDNSAKLTAPDTYITRSETTIQGDITSGINSVVMYVKTDSEFKQVDLDDETNGEITGISVSGDSFSRDLTLSDGDGPGNELLSLPGTYQVALRSQSSLSERYNDVPTTLSVPAILSENTSIQTLRVKDTNITLDKPGVDGSIATTESSVTVEGTVDDRESALIVAIGDRGSVETVQVDGPNFSDVAIPINNFANGIVTVHAVSVGRDGKIGDGEFNEDQINTLSSSPLEEFAQYLTAVADSGATGKQIRAVLRSESDLDVASDDPVVMRELRVMDPKITIDSPVQNQPVTGDTIQVRGQINIPSNSARIETELRKRGAVTTDAYIREWDGASWNTTLSIPENASGKYTLTVDTRKSSRTSVQIMVEQTSKTVTTSSTANPTSTPATSRSTVDNQRQTEDTQSRITTVPSNVAETPLKALGTEVNATEAVDVTKNNSTEDVKLTETISTPLELSGFVGSTLILIFICMLSWFLVQSR